MERKAVRDKKETEKQDTIMKNTESGKIYRAPSMRMLGIGVRRCVAMSIGGSTESYTKRYKEGSFEELMDDNIEIEW